MMNLKIVLKFSLKQNLIEMTSNIIDIVALGVGFKCPRKIYLNTQWGGGVCPPRFWQVTKAPPAAAAQALLDAPKIFRLRHMPE